MGPRHISPISLEPPSLQWLFSTFAVFSLSLQPAHFLLAGRCDLDCSFTGLKPQTETRAPPPPPPSFLLTQSHISLHLPPLLLPQRKHPSSYLRPGLLPILDSLAPAASPSITLSLSELSFPPTCPCNLNPGSLPHCWSLGIPVHSNIQSYIAFIFHNFPKT